MTPLVRSNPPGVGSRALDFKLLGLALQLPFPFEVSAASGGLVSSPP